MDSLDNEPLNLDELNTTAEIEINEVEEIEPPNDPSPPPPICEDLEFTCDLCDWKVYKNCKDKHRARRNHYKNKHPEYYAEHFPTRVKKADKQKPQKVNIIEGTADIIEQVKSVTTDVGVSEDEQRQKLLDDLAVLKVKFQGVDFNWTHTPDSSLETLRREKTLFLRIIQDQVCEQSIMRLLVVFGKGAENITSSLNIADLDGYANDIGNAEDELLPIIRELVDTGVINASALTPEMRMAMVMVSLAVSRGEKNKVLRGGAVVEE